MEEIIFTVQEGGRIDKLTADNTDISRSFAAKLCEDGLIEVNGKAVDKKYKASEGDAVVIHVPEPEQQRLFRKIFLLILFMRIMM